MRRSVVFLVLLCALVALPAVAAGTTTTTVYASPGGTSSGPCSTAATACSLGFALSTYRTQANVTLLLESGTYPALTAATAITGTAFTVAPDPADLTRPVVQLSGGEDGSGELDLGGSGQTLTGIDLDASSTTYTAVDASTDALLSDLRIDAQGYTGLVLASGTLRDSLIVDTDSDSGGGYGVLTQVVSGSDSPSFDSDTIVAPTGTAVDFNPEGGGATVQATLTDTIAQGSTSAEDLLAQDVSGGLASATATSDDLIATGFSAEAFSETGDVTTAPQLSSADQYREQAGSATIGTGTVTSTAQTDLDGNLRSINGTQDIGAYEFGPAPALGTVSATRSSDGTTATLSVAVTPGGELTSVLVNDGTTTSYGSSTAAVSVGNSTTAQTETFTLNGLSATGTYHANVVASSDGGSSTSQDVTITPPAENPPSSPPATTTVASTPPTGPPTVQPIPTSTTSTAMVKLGAKVSVSCLNEKTLSCAVSGGGQGVARSIECALTGASATCTGAGTQMQCHTQKTTVICTGEQLNHALTCKPSAAVLKQLAIKPKGETASTTFAITCNGTPSSGWTCHKTTASTPAGCTFMAGNTVVAQVPAGTDTALRLQNSPTAVLDNGHAAVKARCVGNRTCSGTLLMVAARYFTTFRYSVPAGKVSTLSIPVRRLIAAGLQTDGNGLKDGSAYGVAMLALAGTAKQAQQELSGLEAQARTIDAYGDEGFTNGFLAARSFDLLDFGPGINPSNSGTPLAPNGPSWNTITNVGPSVGLLTHP